MANNGYADNLHIKQIPVMPNTVTCPNECRLCMGDVVYTTTDNMQSNYDVNRYICRVDGTNSNDQGWSDKYFDINLTTGTNTEISEDQANNLFMTGAIDYFFRTWSPQITCDPISLPSPPEPQQKECNKVLQRTLNLFKIN